MATEKQQEANRKNSLLSTGPRSPQGKSRSSKNALRHGLRSRQVLIPGEDPDELAELAGRLRDELQPVGILEEELADRITSAFWRLRRVGCIDAGLLALQMYRVRLQDAEQEARRYETTELDELLQSLSTTITDKEAHAAALEKVRAIRAELDADEVAALGKVFSGLDFSPLSRYEAGIERSLYKALHEIQRLQATRYGSGAPVPAIVEVIVDGRNDE